MRKISLFLMSLFLTVGAMAQIDTNKWYRIKYSEGTNDLYLNVGTRSARPYGHINMVAEAEEVTQLFSFIANEDGTYKLKSFSASYIQCAEWNVNATTDVNAASSLVFEAVSDENPQYKIKWDNTYKGAVKYFKVESVSDDNGIYHPFGDADAGAIFTLIEVPEYVVARIDLKNEYKDSWGEGFPKTQSWIGENTIASSQDFENIVNSTNSMEELNSIISTIKENAITYKIRMYNAGREKDGNGKWYVSGRELIKNGNDNSYFIYEPLDRTLKQIATGKYLVSGNTPRGQYQEMVSDANNASKFKFTQSDRIDGAWSVYDSYGYMCDWGHSNILFSLEASTDNWATWTVEVETITPEVPEVPVEFSYETLDKPTFAKGGNTTKVAMIEFNSQNLSGFTYTQGATERFDMPQVEAGKTYSLNLTYEMAWGDLAIYQIDKNNNEKKYGYYTCVWSSEADPFIVLVNNDANKSLMCEELGISSLEELDATSAGDYTYLTIPYQITIDKNLEPGDIVVVRVMVGKSDKDAYNAKDVSEGGCLDLVFTVTEPEVVPVELAAGKYFRLKGKNGEYLTNDGTGGNNYNTTLQTKSEADINSIFYIEQGDAENKFYILSYENGHYVANPYRIGVGEEAIPKSNEIYRQQWEITGSNGVYTLKYGIEYGSGHYMTNPSTGVTGWSDNVNESAWTLEEVTELPVTISAAGWATFYAPVEVKKPEGVKAYYLLSDGVMNGYVTMEEITIDIIPANSAVVLEGEAKEHSFEITNNGYTAISDNLFQGTVAAEYILGEAYVLGYIVAEEGQQEKKEVGLYKTTLNKLDNTAFLNNGHKVYLPANAVPTNVALSASLRFDFGGITTAIEEVETENAETVIYDLTGRRVNEITKAGVYIINGKKTLVK